MTSLWFDRQICGFDLETTAPDPQDARIVSASVVRCGGQRATESRSLLVDPGIEIPAEATAVHGITTERARADGERAAAAVAEVTDALTVELAHGRPLVIFNARYDLTVLDRECRRHNITPLTERPVALLVVDPLVIDKWLHRYRKGSRKLDAICEHYNVVLDGAHDADYDAIAAARLAWRIARSARVVRNRPHEAAPLQAEWDRVRGDLPALHAAQARWAEEQALGLAEYFLGQQKMQEAASVRTEWPLVPLSEAVAA